MITATAANNRNNNTDNNSNNNNNICKQKLHLKTWIVCDSILRSSAHKFGAMILFQCRTLHKHQNNVLTTPDMQNWKTAVAE